MRNSRLGYRVVRIFCLLWDVCTNGYLKTDLEGLGIFILCIGGFMAGGGINKAASEFSRNKSNRNKEEKK